MVAAALVAVVAVAERPRLLCSPLSCVSRVNCGGAAESEAERSGSVGGGGTEAKSWTRVSWGEADMTGRLESMYGEKGVFDGLGLAGLLTGLGRRSSSEV